MALKKYRPLTPSLRYKLSPDFAEITASKPEKSLIVKTNEIVNRIVKAIKET